MDPKTPRTKRRSRAATARAVCGEHITEQRGNHPVLALVETARRVPAAAEHAATPIVSRLVFGSIDLAAELSVAPEDRTAGAHARSALVMASAAAGLAPPIDEVTASIDAHRRFGHDIGYGARLGFGAKLCVHPAQVAVAASAFAPDADDVAWAHRVLSATDASAMAVVDGRMVGKPVIDRARRVLAAGTQTPAGMARSG